MHRTSPFVVLTLLAAVPLAAQSVRDSAGIRIVTDARPWAALPAWHVVAKPVLDIGGGEAGENGTFFNVMGTVRLGDGAVAVANMATTQIRIFGPTGTFLRAIGRKGGGPGEFQQIMGLTAPHDTLVAADAMGGPRVFTAAGKFVRQIPAVTGDPRGQLMYRGVFGDGTMLYVADRRSPPGAKVYMAMLLRGTPDGKTFHDFAIVPSNEMGTTESVMDARWGWALFPDRFCHGFSTTFEISCRTPAGAVAMIIRRPIPPTPVTDAVKQVYKTGATHLVSAEHPGPPTAADIAAAQREAEKFVYPKVMPMFGPFVAGRSGELWVSEFQMQVDWPNGQWKPSPPGPTNWTVFGADGKVLARIVLPARFVLFDAGADYLLGVQRDGDDVEHVVMYKLQRS